MTRTHLLPPGDRMAGHPGPLRRRRDRAAQRGGIFAKLAALVVLVVICGVIYLARHPLLRLAGNFWIVSDPPAASDAIIILSDDDFSADRAAYAAKLYRAGWAPRIIASGTGIRPYISFADLMQHDLELRGVPVPAIVPYAHDPADTLEELSDLEGFTASRGWRRLLIVTSNYHTRRARYLARRIFPPGFDVRVVAAPDRNYDPNSWWRTRKGLKIFLHESVGMIVAMWEIHHRKPAAGGGRALREGPVVAPGRVTFSGAAVYSASRLYYSARTASTA